MDEVLTKKIEQANSAEILADARYLRERAQPSVKDLFFLILSDLRKLVARHAPSFQGLVFDYGCGGSPYRDLFRSANQYIRADMLPGPGVDLVLSPDGKTGEPAGVYQGVVSFQVLEHVKSPGEYLDECYRLLAADGLLLVTTHGMYFEHKCPNDYNRWTSQGLEELVSSHGFKVIESSKLTTGLRGGMQLQHYLIEELVHRPPTFGGLLLKAFRRVYRKTAQPLLNAFARRFLGSEGVVAAENRETLYVGVAILARKV
jgi:hypothetical protein